MSPPDSKRLEPEAAFDLLSTCAKLLFANGQTTERMTAAVQRLAVDLGFLVHVFPRWGELALRIEDGAGWRHEIIAVEPAGVDINKVVATMDVVDRVSDGRMGIAAVRTALDEIAQLPPVSMVRFALMAGAGAAALGVIFGVAHLLSLVLIALSAGAGACLRRWLAGKSHNLFLQPLCASFLAGLFGALIVRLQLSSAFMLVAVCPCMVLVPGPHFLNGLIDLARARIVLGAARLAYASLITVMICTGLLLGLALGGVDLPPSGPFSPVPLLYDVVAAGVAVAAYGTFFAMPWRMLPIPVLIGMLAHALRWGVLSMGASAEIGALVACLLVGTVSAPIADRLRLPFVGLAFASVVSLIPGVFLFRMAGGMVDLVTQGAHATPELVTQIAADGTTALLIILAMAFGLIFPRLCIDWH
jgi:uncharacterized membrane protein YjjP (DUF1212 family)